MSTTTAATNGAGTTEGVEEARSFIAKNSTKALALSGELGIGFLGLTSAGIGLSVAIRSFRSALQTIKG